MLRQSLARSSRRPSSSFDMMTRLLSPYQFNPINLQPAARRVEPERRFRGAAQAGLPGEAVPLGDQCPHRQGQGLRAATRFSADAVLASACLPFMFQAVEIDGEAYWDGGYMGNPALLSADLQLRELGHRRSSTSIRWMRNEAAAHRDRDPEPHQRDQLQFLAHARDAGDQFRHRLIDEGKVNGNDLKRLYDSRHLGRG